MTSPDETSPTISGTAPRDDALVAGPDVHAPGQPPGGEGPHGPDIRYSPVSAQAKGNAVGPVEAEALGLGAQAATQDQVDEQASEAAERPAKNASTEDWRAYAVTQGAARADVDTMTRDDLAARYGA